MKKLLLALLLVIAGLFTFAPSAKADCGYWTTQYRQEQVYVPPRLLGYTREGYPYYSAGYYYYQTVPYSVWVSTPCPQPTVRFYGRYYSEPRPRHTTRWGFSFRFGW